MAVITTNLSCELQEAVKVQYLKGNLFSQDAQANKISVAVYDGGTPATISGTVTANIIREDGGTVTATGGTISGNVVSITLPAAAYIVPGLVSIVIKVTASSVTTTIAAVVVNVYQSSTETAIDPGTIIPSVTALVAQIETAVASIPADYSSLWTSLAPAFSSSASYTPGQYVTYNGGLYICTTAHTGSWNANHFSTVNVGGELSRVFSAINDESNMVNDVLDIDYNKQYLLGSSWIGGGYYSRSNGAVVVTANNDYKHYPAILGLPAGTYSFYNLARGYSIVQYVSDGSLHTFTELGATTSRGTLTISEKFNLFTSATAATADGMFVNDISYPASYIEGIYRYNSNEIDKISDLEFDFYANYQWLDDENKVAGSYYNISNGAITVTSNNDYVRWNPIRGLKAGTYSFKRLVTGYTILEYSNGELHKLNEFDVVAARGTFTVPYNFTLYASTGTNYPTEKRMFVNADELPQSNVEGIYKNGWTDVKRFSKSDPITFYQNNTVKTVAHRGDFIVAPQCTGASYIIARKRGITIAENDLNITADGQFVMYHGATLSVLGNLVDLNGYLAYTDGTSFYFYDEENSVLYNEDYTVSSKAVSSLTRCAGANYQVEDMQFSLLRKLSFGAYKGEQFTSQKILTFGEWILLCKQLGMDAYIDRKIAYDNSVLDALFDIVQNYGMRDNVVWIGLTHAQGEYLRIKDSNAKFAKMRDISDTTLLNEWKDLQGGRGVEIIYDGKTVTETAVHDALQAGYTVQVYYVDVTNLSKADVMTAVRTFVGYGANVVSLDHYRVWEAFEDLLNQF